jgi:hypothetical protein
MKAANLTLRRIELLFGGCTITVVFSGTIHSAFAAPKHEEGRSAILELVSGRMPRYPRF